MGLLRGALVLALGAIVCPACGRGESGPSAGASEVAKSPPAPVAPPPAAGPVPLPGGSKTASTEASQKGAFDADAEYDKGAALAAGRRFADARQVFEEAARRAPADGALAAAVAISADLAAKRVSEDVVQRLFRAGQHANAGRLAEAHADIDEAIRLAPGYARAHGLRGTLWLQQGKPADALKAFEQVVKLDPGFAEGHYNRGATYAALEQHDAAIADFSRAIELKPDFWDAYANRGLAHQSRGLARQDKQAYNKGQALERMDRPKEAAAEYRILLQKAGSLDDDLVRRTRQRLAAIEKSPED